jgi:23S rRNA pseudouridine1911/1915/1917 synthase
MVIDRKIDKTETIVCDNDIFCGKRWDIFLVDRFPDYSRSYFQKLIKEGFISVNDKVLSKSSYIIRLNDKITVSFPVEKQPDLSPQKVDFEIVDETADFIVVNKPAGLAVHPSKEGKEGVTLVNGLLYHFKELEKFNNTERPGIVHRIDKNTSGLLLVAKNMQAQNTFSKMFAERKIKKTYLAIAKGHPEKEGTIELPIGRHPVERHKMSHVSYDGRKATTHYKVLNYYKNSSLVSVNIVTGRTHQIRVHLAAIGHGLIGDSVYGIQSKLIKRQALHAWKLAFEFKGKEYDYCISVPEDFVNLLKSSTVVESI